MISSSVHFSTIGGPSGTTAKPAAPASAEWADSEGGCTPCHQTSPRKPTRASFLCMGSPATAIGTIMMSTPAGNPETGKHRQPLGSASTPCCRCRQGGVTASVAEQRDRVNGTALEGNASPTEVLQLYSGRGRFLPVQ